MRPQSTWTRTELMQAAQRLGITPEAFDRIRRAPLPRAREMLADLQKVAKRNHRRWALELHPDRNGGDEAKMRELQCLNAAAADVANLSVGPPRAPRTPPPPPPAGAVVWVRVGGFSSGFGSSTTSSTTASTTAWWTST